MDKSVETIRCDGEEDEKKAKDMIPDPIRLTWKNPSRTRQIFS